MSGRTLLEGDAPAGRLALTKALAERGIRSVLFIDDGFDAISDQEPTTDQQDEIWAAILNDAGAHEAAMAMGVMDADQVAATFVEGVLSHPAGALRDVVTRTPYVVTHTSKAAALAIVIDYLRALRIEVRTSGSKEWQDKLGDVQVVFLDWRLGPDGDANAVLTASAAAREIHQQRSRPFLVLISSDPSVKQHSEAFSRASGLVGGMFDAIPKAWFADEVEVGVNLSVIIDLYAAGDVIQRFMESLRTHADAAVGQFRERIERLTVSDYANLQRFALRKDGHPLGDYLTELFSGLWADVLFQGDLRAQLHELDTQDFESLPALTGPSDALTDLHLSAVFDTHVGALAPHPHAAATDAARLQLSLGDVILERKEGRASRVYAVLNPQCDLAESPRGGRRMGTDQSILLVPGTIEAIDHAHRTERKESGDTPFIRIDGVARRVHWSAKAMTSVPYETFGEWLGEERQRIARMRPLHALALQRVISAELTRVGLPNPPPIHDAVDIEVARACFGKWSPGDQVVKKQARLVMTRDSKGDRIVFDHSFLIEIATLMREGLEEATGKRAKWIPKDEEALEAVRAALGDPTQWQGLSRPFTMPDAGLKLFGDALLVCTKKPKVGIPRKLLVCIVVDSSGVPS